MMIDKISIEDLEEEFRLMYGAKTPAGENPIFIYSDQIFDRMMGMKPDRPSRRIDGVPQTILATQPARF